MEEEIEPEGPEVPKVRGRYIKKRALKNKAVSVSFDEKDLKYVPKTLNPYSSFYSFNNKLVYLYLAWLVNLFLWVFLSKFKFNDYLFVIYTWIKGLRDWVSQEEEEEEKGSGKEARGGQKA